jgi:hypothetical protein
MAIMSPDPKDTQLRGKQLDQLCDRFCKTGDYPSPSEPQF